MCESYSGPAKSGPIKRLTRLNSGPIKRSRLYLYAQLLITLTLPQYAKQIYTNTSIPDESSGIRIIISNSPISNIALLATNLQIPNVDSVLIMFLLSNFSYLQPFCEQNPYPVIHKGGWGQFVLLIIHYV